MNPKRLAVIGSARIIDVLGDDAARSNKRTSSAATGCPH
jgi:hypothetical protein